METYGLHYTWQGIDISQNVQKERWFTAINPNGRIPAIVDHNNGDLAVFEGSAILSYLTRRYDPEHHFSFAAGDDDYTCAEAWIAWQQSAIGPMLVSMFVATLQKLLNYNRVGQARTFLRGTPEAQHWGINRFVRETKRLYGVLNDRLEDRDWVVGPGRGRYSIADIALVGYTSLLPWFSAVSLDNFPAVKAWLQRCLDRPAVQRGLKIPKPHPFQPFTEPDSDMARELAELEDLVRAAEAQFGQK